MYFLAREYQLLVVEMAAGPKPQPVQTHPVVPANPTTQSEEDQSDIEFLCSGTNAVNSDIEIISPNTQTVDCEESHRSTTETNH